MEQTKGPMAMICDGLQEEALCPSAFPPAGTKTLRSQADLAFCRKQNWNAMAPAGWALAITVVAALRDSSC